MTVKSAFQIEIPKRGNLCHFGKELLVPGSDIYSTLREGANEGSYERQDFCQSCWEKLLRENNSDFRISWRSRIPLKKGVSDLPKQRDARAMYLLKEALKCNEADDHAEAFILALYLARKRIIYFRQDLVLEDGHPASIYEIAETEEMLCIRKMSLSSLEVDKIQQRLARKFLNG